ncbi:sugar phosphate isomerase/epimerase family protein [Speluncibacter jeojiensis]|uniref:Sugar phosphate isomerase/epimerase n=1 Tax=Speluncibacter jeojiensis TaxID=2710754 RepID=A0A9X4M575_9ACTN|nr:sugar phosphate isomerase/epimerase family protein [Rhodococcus sp. D2-41]MDG3015483.1 sugar phosphate isomerase/epimerase [Corynebacteriales bacterium D3-21]
MGSQISHPSEDPNLSVCLAATAAWPLADSLVMLDRMGCARFGVLAATMERQGWESSIATIRGSGLRPEFIAGGCRAMHDGDGWGRVLGSLERAVDAAAEIGAPTVGFTSGGSGALSWEAAADRAVGRFAPLVDHARAAGVGLALENTMSIRSAMSFTHSVADTAELARRLGVGLMVDLYSAFQERDLMRTVADNLDSVLLVQIGDHRTSATSVPNRWVPGDGEIPLERLVREVRELGYRGTVDLELLGPAIDEEGAERALGRGWEWMRAHVP